MSGQGCHLLVTKFFVVLPTLNTLMFYLRSNPTTTNHPELVSDLGCSAAYSGMSFVVNLLGIHLSQCRTPCQNLQRSLTHSLRDSSANHNNSVLVQTWSERPEVTFLELVFDLTILFSLDEVGFCHVNVISGEVINLESVRPRDLQYLSCSSDQETVTSNQSGYIDYRATGSDCGNIPFGPEFFFW